MEIRMGLDRLNFRIEDVHVDDFQRFYDALDVFETMGLVNVRRQFKTGASDYAYNLYFGQGDEAWLGGRACADARRALLHIYERVFVRRKYVRIRIRTNATGGRGGRG